MVRVIYLLMSFRVAVILTGIPVYVFALLPYDFAFRKKQDQIVPDDHQFKSLSEIISSECCCVKHFET